jgi:ABC-type nitrate/sulfonate/bicarbonate transport system permease component
LKTSGLHGILVVLFIWLLVTEAGLIQEVFLPPPHATLAEFWRLLASGALLQDSWRTLSRTIQGFTIGAAVGVLLGFLMGAHRWFYETLEFPLDFFRSIPATALFPLFIVIFGLGSQVKIFVALWATAMVVTVNTFYGVRSVSPERTEVARVKRVPFRRRFLLLVIPSAAPYILAGCRIGLSLALVVEIVAEMFLGADSGLGRRIYNASSIFKMEEAYASVLGIGLLGYGLNKLLIELERKVVHWKG